MLGSDRFSFETPNVIDPGDLPPSQPKRDSIANNTTVETISPTLSTDDEDDYLEARDSKARLLRDIDDLELSPSVPIAKPYDPYEEDEEEDEPRETRHSLPTVEEARLYAASLLHSSSKGRKRSPSERSTKLDSGSHHLVRKRVLAVVWRAAALLAVVVVLIGIGIGISNLIHRNQRSTIVGDREKMVFGFLIDNEVSAVQDLASVASPQWNAAKWIASSDVLQLPVPEGLQDGASIRFIQRYTLAVFFFALNGPNWTDTHYWMAAEDECGWFETQTSVDRINPNTAVGITCDADLMVKSIFLPLNQLAGSLPVELRHLSRLDMLALPDNNIGGRLPSEISTLTWLNFLDVRHNEISGFLPDWIGNLNQLEVLGLSNCQFAGPIPPSYGTLGRLKTLAIDDNALTGSLAFAKYLTNLQYFWADRNLLTGQVDDNFLSDLPKLVELDLSSNALAGIMLPQHLLQHPTLEVLDLSDNNVQAAFPEVVNANNVLSFLALRQVGLISNLPDSIRNLRALTHLDLFGNSLNGTLPNTMGELVNLQHVFLGDNQYSPQEFPPLFSQLINLRELSLTSAKLTGAIPKWMSYLNNLELLDLSSNQLQASIPQEVWDLPLLAFLLLNDNPELTGDLPTSVQGVEGLRIVSLFHTSVTGDANYFCTANPDMDLLATDCTVSCSKDCCQECCASDDTTCFVGQVNSYLSWYEGMWEFNFTRAAYSFDPAILDESGFLRVVEPAP